jgi:hypothetical protein
LNSSTNTMLERADRTEIQSLDGTKVFAKKEDPKSQKKIAVAKFSLSMRVTSMKSLIKLFLRLRRTSRRVSTAQPDTYRRKVSSPQMLLKRTMLHATMLQYIIHSFATRNLLTHCALLSLKGFCRQNMILLVCFTV